MVICPDCGKDVPESKFCKNCGAYIKDVKPVVKSDVVGFCSSCGSEIEAGNSFCPQCGSSVSDIEEAEPVVESKAFEKSGEIENDGFSLESDEVNVVPVSLDGNVDEEIVEQDEGEASVESDSPQDNNVLVPVKQDVVEISLKSNNLEEDATKKIRFCFNCGNKLIGDFKFCPECGQNLTDDIAKSQAPTSSGEKSIILAIILSVFLPGLGQIYLGLDHKGAIFLIAYVISAILILILIGFLLCFIIWIWALIDTIISTNALNRGDEVKDKLL